MNTSDVRSLIAQLLNQLRAALRSEDLVVSLLDELDRVEVAVARAARNGLIDALEAQAYRVTIEAILRGTEPEPEPEPEPEATQEERHASPLHAAFARLDAATSSMDLVDQLLFIAKHGAFLRRLAQADQAVLMEWVCGRDVDGLLVRAMLALANTDAELVSLGGLRGSYAGHSLLLNVATGKLLRQRHADGRVGRSICEAQAAWDLAGYARPVDALREAALYAAGEAGRDRRLQD